MHLQYSWCRYFIIGVGSLQNFQRGGSKFENSRSVVVEKWSVEISSVSELTASSSQNLLMGGQAASSSQNSMTDGCGSGESILTTGGTEGIPRSDLTCGGGGGAASSYLVQPTSTGLLDGNSLKKASRDGYTCCVPGCYNNTKKNRELSFYKFPREKVTRG